MAGKLAIVSTSVVTAVLTSAFWIFAYNLTTAPSANDERQVDLAGDIATIRPKEAPPVSVAEGTVVGPAGLAIPVAGLKANDLVDTYTQARAGGARLHDAIDILAPEGTPVLAAAPGVVEKLFYSEGGGGITAYVRSPDRRWIYYYAHLQGYMPGLKEGQAIQRRQQIGMVGHTGNASARGSHLHFAIHRATPTEKWHQGTAINPYPLLAGKSS